MEINELLASRKISPGLRVIGRKLAEAIKRLESRCDRAEEIGVRMRRVESIDELPASASPLAFYRVSGDPFIYVGNGEGFPLRRISTSALP